MSPALRPLIWYTESIMTLREKIYNIIYEAETPVGKAFDIILISAIFLSVIVVMADTVSSLNQHYGELFYMLEWIFTIFFSIEYIFRVWSIKKPSAYITSFFGIIDLLAILPTYLSLIIPGTQYILVIRLLRVLRIFRVLKLAQFIKESSILVQSLKASGRKILVFIFAVLILVTLLGSFMYSIEGGENGFTSIPKSIYWAVVTLTTVGYGDIAPTTHTGQFFAVIIMLLGYGIIAVPAGIVTSELSIAQHKSTSTEVCPHCSKEGHDKDAKFCKRCGGSLNHWH